MSDEEQQNTPPPPPPENPEGTGGYQEEGYTPNPDAIPEEEAVVESSGPAVAATASKNMILILVGGVLGLFLLYQIFSGGDEVAPVPVPTPTVDSEGGAPVASATEIPIPANPIQPPPLPPPPPIPEPDVAPLPPPPPVTPDIDFMGDGPTNEELKKRRASEMLIVNGSAKDSKKDEEEGDVTSVAERAVATKVGQLDTLVLQGKILDAVLETALDTTLQGPLRAIVSRDVYAESGYGVLIPKGSRLIGTYRTDIVRGQGRVFIIWSRLIRPDGIDIQINSQAIDRLGRSGITGYVDERYFEIFGGALLTSILGITLAGVADAILDPPQSTTTQNTDGASTSTTSAVDTAITAGVKDIGSVAKQVVGGLLDARPSITIDQGTPLKVYVNRDLEFPNENTSRVRVIQ